MRKKICLGLALVIAMVAAGCGSDGSADPTSAGGADPDRPVVVATTSILGDVVENLAGEHVEVITVMPRGADPHDFQPSAADVANIEKAAAVIVNGADFEEGLLDAIDSARERGIPVFEAISAVDPLRSDGHKHDEHEDDEEHDDEEHDDDEEHEDEDHDNGEDHDDEHAGIDPHFFTDPARMADAAVSIVEFLAANVEGIDLDALRSDGEQYVTLLRDLDAEVRTILDDVPEDRRVLVTNHDVYSYFADQYDFVVAGTIVDAGTSTAAVSGRRLADLSDLLDDAGIPVVFADAAASDDLARTLAEEVGDVSVTTLYSESLGEPGSDAGTYQGMIRFNANAVASALAS